MEVWACGDGRGGRTEVGVCQPFLQVASLHGGVGRGEGVAPISSVFLSGSLYLAQPPPPRWIQSRILG